MPRRLALLWLLALAALALAAPVGAAPIVYSFTTGTATLTVESQGVLLGAAVGDLTGTQVTFDATSVDLVDFGIQLDETVITLDPTVSGISTLVVESAVFTPGLGYSTLSSQDLGGGDYTATVGPVNLTGTYRADGPGTELPSTPFSIFDPLLTADLSISDGELSLLGITLGTLTLTTGDVLVVKADLAFTGMESAGAIPEPSGALLMGAGLLLVVRQLRSRDRG